MTIDPDVKTVATRFGVDARLLQAVVQAEGDIVKAVRCSLPSITTRAEALDVLARSAVHAMCDFLAASDERNDFVAFWGARWAPVGVANDPHDLNNHWVGNVQRIWLA